MDRRCSGAIVAQQRKVTRRRDRALQVMIGVGLSLCVSTAVEAQSNVRISGYGNMHYMDHDGVARLVGIQDLNNGFFQIREFSLFFDIAITDAVVASTEIEAGDNGTVYTANYAYVDFQATANLSLRAGKVLVPFLSYNENKPNFKQNLMSQPFTAWNLAPVNGIAINYRGFGWSDAGLVANWNNELGGWGLFDVKAAVINGLGSNSDVLDDNFVQLNAGMMTPVVRPRDGLIQNEITNSLRDNNNDKATVLKVTLQPLALLSDIGFSWYRGKWNPSGTRNLTMLGAHVNVLQPNWTLKSEYVVAQVEQTAGSNPVADAGLMGPAPLNTSTGDYNMKAWYVEASVIPVRGTNNRYLRLVGRYDDVDTNDQIGFTPFDRSRVTVGAEFQFASNTRFRFEWQRSVIDDFQNAPAPYIGAGGEESIKMAMASVIFSF